MSAPTTKTTNLPEALQHAIDLIMESDVLEEVAEESAAAIRNAHAAYVALEAERNKLRAWEAEIEAQKPVLEVRACGCEAGKNGRCVMGDYGLLPIGAKLYAHPVSEQTSHDSCGACGDACATRESCRLADESPEAAR